MKKACQMSSIVKNYEKTLDLINQQRLKLAELTTQKSKLQIELSSKPMDFT